MPTPDKMSSNGGKRVSDPFHFDPETPEHRENAVRNDLLNRLKGVCKEMPEAEFQDLVAAMTREQLRSERLR